MALRKYPWEIWFSAPRMVLRRGVDYHISQAMMYQTVRNNASRRALIVRVEDAGDAIIITNVGVAPDGISRADKATITSEPETALAQYGCNEEETAPGNDDSHEGDGNTTSSVGGGNNANWAKEARRRQPLGRV